MGQATEKKCYAIWEVVVDGETRRLPILHGRGSRKSIVFPTPADAERALAARARKHRRDSRGLIYTIPVEGSAFDFPPVRTVAL